MKRYASKSEYGLDALALLCLLLGEPGYDVIEPLLASCVIGATNYAEVIGKLIDKGFSADRIEVNFSAVNIPVIDLHRDVAAQAGFLRKSTMHLGLSLGDRTCLALATKRNAPALTTDRIWANLDIDISVQLVR